MAQLTLYAIWLLWAVSWMATSFWSAPAVGRVAFSGQLLYRLVTLAGFLLLFGFWSPRMMAMTQLWRPREAQMWCLDLVVLLGFALCWWARIHLADIWSSGVTRKEGHRVIDTGPYALMRHPIYTGLIIAAFASAALMGTAVALIGAMVMAFGWFLKARVEEDFLRAELGAAAYGDYAARTAMFIPFVRF